MPTPREGYRAADGAIIPGTTTIIGRFKESGGLIRWAYGRGKAGVDLYGERDSAADIGTAIHDRVEHDLREEPAPELSGYTDEEAKSVQRGFDAFRRWAEGSRLEISPVEKPLVCEHLRFGGTPDAIAIEPIDERLSMLDWKSGKQFYPDQLIQLIAYVHLWNDNHPEAQINGFIHVIRFGKLGADFEHRSFTLDDPRVLAAWKLFKLYREAFDLDKIVTSK